jgi:PAS domain S-box-containing protein
VLFTPIFEEVQGNMTDAPILSIAIVARDMTYAHTLQADLLDVAQVQCVTSADAIPADVDVVLITDLADALQAARIVQQVYWVTDSVSEVTLADVALAGVWLRPFVRQEVRRQQAHIEQQWQLNQLQIFKQTCDSAVEAVVITDAALDKPGPRIVYVNRAFCEMTGYSSSELIGKTPRILQGVGTDFDMLTRLRESLERGHSFQGETVNHRKDSRPYIVEWNIEPLRNEQGTITHFASTQRDLTERKRLGDTLKRVSATLQEARSVLGLSDNISERGSDNFPSEDIISSVDLIGIDNTLRRLTQRARLSASFEDKLERKGGARNLLQSLAMLGLNGMLTIEGFTLYLQDRHVVHLEHPDYPYDNQAGDNQEAGLQGLLRLQEGDFRFDPNVYPERETMRINLMSALLEPEATPIADSSERTLVVPDIAAALALIASNHSDEAFRVEGGYYPTQDKTYVTFRSPNLSILSLSGSVSDVPKDILHNVQ